MTDATKLAQAILDMAEKDKGLVLSKLEELIEDHQKPQLNASAINLMKAMAKAGEMSPEEKQKNYNAIAQALAERAAFVREEEMAKCVRDAAAYYRPSVRF